MNIIPDLLIGRAAYARLKADATVRGLIPRGSQEIRMFPSVAPDGTEPPYLTYDLAGTTNVAQPRGGGIVSVTVGWQLTAWRRSLSQQPLEALALAAQAALCGATLLGRTEVVEGVSLHWRWGGPVPVPPDVGDEGKWTRVATLYWVQLMGNG